MPKPLKRTGLLLPAENVLTNNEVDIYPGVDKLMVGLHKLFPKIVVVTIDTEFKDSVLYGRRGDYGFDRIIEPEIEREPLNSLYQRGLDQIKLPAEATVGVVARADSVSAMLEAGITVIGLRRHGEGKLTADDTQPGTIKIVSDYEGLLYYLPKMIHEHRQAQRY